MPIVPRTNARYSLPASAGGVRIDAEAAGAGMRAVSRAAGQFSEVFAEQADREAKAVRALQLAKANAEATRALDDLAIGLERDPDWAGSGDKFDSGAKAIRQGALKTLGDPTVQREFEIGFDRLTEPRRVALKRRALENGEKDALATLDSSIEILSQSAAAAPNDVARTQIFATAAKTITDLRDAGWIDPQKAEQSMRTFRSRVDEAGARRLITTDPELALAQLNQVGGAEDRFRNLDPVARARLVDQATSRADTETRRRIAADEREDRQAEKRMKTAREEASKSLWDQWAANGGQLDVGAVRAEKGRLNDTDYRALLQAALAKAAETDRPDAARELKLHVDDEAPQAFERRAFGLLQRGEISLATYRGEVERNRSFARDDGPLSPIKTARQYIKIAMDPGQLGGDPAIRQPLAMAQGAAFKEFESWIEKNPGLERSVVMQRAEEIVARYQNIGFGEMRLALPRPRGFSGGKNSVAQPDIDRARSAVLQDIDQGRLPREDAARELQQLEIWEQVLHRASTAPKPAGTK